MPFIYTGTLRVVPAHCDSWCYCIAEPMRTTQRYVIIKLLLKLKKDKNIFLLNLFFQKSLHSFFLASHPNHPTPHVPYSYFLLNDSLLIIIDTTTFIVAKYMESLMKHLVKYTRYFHLI